MCKKKKNLNLNSHFNWTEKLKVQCFFRFLLFLHTSVQLPYYLFCPFVSLQHIFQRINSFYGHTEGLHLRIHIIHYYGNIFNNLGTFRNLGILIFYQHPKRQEVWNYIWHSGLLLVNHLLSRAYFSLISDSVYCWSKVVTMYSADASNCFTIIRRLFLNFLLIRFPASPLFKCLLQ